MPPAPGAESGQEDRGRAGKEGAVGLEPGRAQGRPQSGKAIWRQGSQDWKDAEKQGRASPKEGSHVQRSKASHRTLSIAPPLSSAALGFWLSCQPLSPVQ